MLNHCGASRRVALFGGAFNPPHLAHVFTVNYLLSRTDVDEVWVLPSARHAFGKEMAPFQERLTLLRACFGHMPEVQICEVEAEEGLSGRTFDTLTLLSERSPHISLSLVIGADNLTESHRWYRFDELVARWRVIALGRPGHEEALHLARAASWCSVGPMLPNISSSALREALSSLPPLARQQLSEGCALDQLDPPLPISLYELLAWVPQRCLSLVITHYSPPPLQLNAPPSSPVDVCIWGQGRAGQALQRALTLAGLQVSSVSVRALLGWCEQRPPPSSPSLELIEGAQRRVWIIASRDQQLEQVADALAHLHQALPSLSATHLLSSSPSSPPLVALHCSGSVGPETLSALSNKGVSVAQWHPLQALRGEESARDLNGVAFFVWGDVKASREGERLAQTVGGWALPPPAHFHLLSAQERGRALTLYHCAAVIASNLSLGLFAASVELFVSLGWSHSEATHALTPLSRATLERAWRLSDKALSADGLKRALTGPLARGDVEVITRHLNALSAHSQEVQKRGEAGTELLAEAYLAISRWIDVWLRGEQGSLLSSSISCQSYTPDPSPVTQEPPHD